MATFDLAIDTVLAHEGGFVDHPDDPGGATNYGISLRWLRALGHEVGDLDGDGDVDVDDVYVMTLDEAQHIYRLQIWDRHPYAEIPSQALATKVFDFAVNMGTRQAHKHLQRALRSAGGTLVDDGLFGPMTLATILECAARGATPEVLAALRSEAAGFYRMLVERSRALLEHGHNATDFSPFLNGWLRRAYA